MTPKPSIARQPSKTQPVEGDLPELMTVAEVAAFLRVSDETIHRWCRKGRLTRANSFGPKRFLKADIAGLVRTTGRKRAAA